jgi:hypothetical protein
MPNPLLMQGVFSCLGVLREGNQRHR